MTPNPPVLTQNHNISQSQAGICFHCGLELNGITDQTIDVQGEQKTVCCIGCKAVCELILAGGLEQYYALRSEFAQKAPIEKKAYLEFDDTVFQEPFCDYVEGKPNRRRAHLILDGVHCAACAWLLETSCKKISGLSFINVNLLDNTCIVEWDEDKQKLSAIVAHINDLGFQATPWSSRAHKQFQAQVEKKQLRRIGLAGIVMMQVGMFSIGLYAAGNQGIDAEYRSLLQWFSALLTTPVLLFSAFPFYQSAWRSLRQWHINMDVPVVVALTLAYVASLVATIRGSGDTWFDSVCMFVFLLSAVRYLDNRARNRFSAQVMQDDMPETCKKLRPGSDVDFEYVPSFSVKPGDRILIHRGELIPVDSELLSEQGTFNQASVNGEFRSVHKTAGETLLSGTINEGEAICVRVVKTAPQSWLQQVQRLASQARHSRPRFQEVSDSVARYFSLAVLLLSAITASFWYIYDSQRVIEISLAVLLISCPCALSIAVPSALTVTNNFLRSRGALVCDDNFIEKLSRVNRIIFDKTGTLTEGTFSIAAQHVAKGIDVELANQIASSLEAYSEHPIAKAFAALNTQPLELHNVKLHTNKGVSAELENKKIRIGSQDFCQALTEQPPPEFNLISELSRVWLCDENGWLACYELRDKLRDHVSSTLDQLAVYRPALITGDSSSGTEKFFSHFGFSDIKTNCSPVYKMDYIRQRQEQGQNIVMVGDGINDLPVLAQADVSIAMCSNNKLAQKESDCVLLSNSMALIPLLFYQAKRTISVMRQNITWALMYNFGALPLAAFGLVPPWAAAAGMSVSSLIVVLNASRLRHSHLDS